VILLFSSVTKGELLPSKTLSLKEIQLVRCLTDISHRHFAPGRSLMISSPATYRDVQQELTAEIQRTAIWPVVVTAGNISKRDEADFIDKDGSYIILTPNGNIKYFHAEILELFLDRRNKFKMIWNSEARFVVAGANVFSVSQKIEIFDYFSKFGIYNCIIVSKEHYVMDKGYSRNVKGNDVDTGMKLGVYTWFPYQSSDICTEVNDVTLLDSWAISSQGHFTKNTDLFPRKISKNLNGCPMKAFVRNSLNSFTTFHINYRNSNGNVVTKIKGFEMDLRTTVLKQMNMVFVHVPIPDDFGFNNDLTDSVKRAVIAKEAFIVLGSLGTHNLVDPFLDSTNSYFTMHYRWYIPCSDKYSGWSNIFRILSVQLWLLLIISIVTAAISTTFVGRYSCTSERQVYTTLSGSLTNLWAVILGVVVSTMPRTPSLRSLFLCWVCFSLAFSTVFQAFITTFLVNSPYKTPIQNMDDLLASGIKLAYPKTYAFRIEIGEETEVSKLNRNRANCSPYRKCIDWAMYHKNTSLLLSDLYVEFLYARGYWLGENSEPLLCRLEDGVVYNDALRMVMLQGDPLMRRVTEIIDRVVEAGLYNFQISKEMNLNKILSPEISLFRQLDGYCRFKLHHMQPAFYLLLMGWCLSIICFMVELLYYGVLNKRK